MKNNILSLALLGALTMTGCNDSFMDKFPVNEPTEENVFSSYESFMNFTWPCYEVFSNDNIATSIGNSGFTSVYRGDMDAGYLERREETGYNIFAYQEKPSMASGNGWSFGYLRRVNMMLSHIENSSLTEAEKKHWQAIGYFFHSYWYAELIDRFGDVPWIDKVLNDASEEQFGPRSPRKEVADKVLERLKWAEENIGDFSKVDGNNVINKDCVLALISRFTLREGTWRKYHELGDYEKYFTECVRASEVLMSKYPTLYQGTDGQPAAGYGEMWTTEDLSKVPGVILFKEIVTQINCHQFNHYEHGMASPIEMNKKTVDLYLMKNGKPIANAESGYDGDKTIYDIYRNRDPRMYHVILPPYKINPKKGDYKTWSYTDNPADREFIDIMGPNETCSNPGIGMKRLPMQNWSATVVPESPKFGTTTFVSSRSGFYVWKNADCWEENIKKGKLNSADKPIFKIEEVLLNFAEAKCELGDLTQGDVDKSINKLRARATVAPMVVGEITDDFDPNRGKYYPKNNEEGLLVDPVLWEVRRERIIELMGEGFGFYDVRRWRMAPWFLNREATGMWLDKASAHKAKLTLYNPETGFSDGINGSLQEGYVFLFNNPVKEGKGWLEKYYLYQIPTTELLLNPQLAPNNPGW